MNIYTIFLGFLIISVITLCSVNADLDSSSETVSNSQYSSGTVSHLAGEENQSLNQNRDNSIPVQTGSSTRENDSSVIPGTTTSAVTHLTGDEKNPSTGHIGYEIPTSSALPTQGFSTGTHLGSDSNTPSSTPSPVMSKVPTPIVTPIEGLPDGNHFRPGSGTPVSTPSPVMSSEPTITVTPVEGLPDGTHFGPGSGTPVSTPSPVISNVPTPIVTPIEGLPDGTHFGPGFGTPVSTPSPEMSNVPTPIVTPGQGLPDGTHFGPGSNLSHPGYSPVVTDVPTPMITPVPDQFNDPYRGPDLNPIYPIPTPTFTQPTAPDVSYPPNYPDGRYPPGPVPTISLVTITVTPTPEQGYYEPTHVPGDNDPDPIMSDILLHRGDPNYYYGRYSNPDPGHYRYESSPLYAPRYDRDSGAIQVISTPTDATVYLNNNYEGRTPSSGYLGISSLTPGTYQITISSVGYYDYTSVITVYRNEVVTINAALEPIASGSSSSRTDGGILDVQSSPSGAGVLLNNVYRGSSPLTLQSISPGAYNLTIFKDGYIWYARDISITAGQTTAVSAVLTPKNPVPPDQNSTQSIVTVVPETTKSPLPIGILFISLIVGGFYAKRRL